VFVGLLVETGQRLDEVAQLDEADGKRIVIGKLSAEGVGDIVYVSPGDFVGHWGFCGQDRLVED
jgi:hypothetical protein